MGKSQRSLLVLSATALIALTSACSREPGDPNPVQSRDDNNTALDGKPVVYDMSYLKGPPPPTPVPTWAFAMDPPETAEYKAQPDDDVPRHVPNSRMAFTRREVLKHTDVIDWHPDNHPPAPAIVMKGRAPQPAACAFCHLPNGIGQPENAPLAGLPESYFVRQVRDFQAGRRKSADMRMASYHGMAEIIAPRVHNDELRDAARYYASVPLRRYLDVIEAATVPKTKSVAYTMLPTGGNEPIGDRIIETPADIDRFHLNDLEAMMRVYVPPGSIARGRQLVTTGGQGRTVPCATCHGTALEGTDDIPPLAGRGPSNLVRQIYNFRTRARDTSHAKLMQPVVDKLAPRDIVDIVAYLASLPPAHRRPGPSPAR